MSMRTIQEVLRSKGTARTLQRLAEVAAKNTERSKAEEQERIGERLALRYGALSLPAVVRRTSHRPVFVHCAACRWPVNPGRTQWSLGADFMPATEEQMQRMCEGLRRMA